MSYSDFQKHELAGKRIIVAGAGLAGLAFACAIDQYWPPQHPKPKVVLYERSARELDRGHAGYTMGIKPGTGLEALERIGLLGQALQSSTVGLNGTEQAPTFWTKDWKPMLDLSPLFRDNKTEDGSVPRGGIRLVRYVLRDMLLNAVPADTEIHWSNGCAKTRVLGNGKVEVELTDGSKDECDLLVAADGANSSVRSLLLPGEKLTYTGAVCFIGTSRFAEGKPELLKHKWGMNISGQGVPFLTFPVDDHTGVWGISYRPKNPRDRIRGAEAIEKQQEILSEVRSKGKMFHDPFNQFISATDPQTLSVFSAMHKYPIVHAEKLPNVNIALIGDANHPMSPFSGNGANMAMLDGVVLAQQLAARASVREAIGEFDKDSVPRSRKSIDKSYWTIGVLHSEGLTFWLIRAVMAVVGMLVWVKTLF